jgi:nitrogen-specific signal transduction histidine kinase
MQQLLDKWERLRKSEYLRPDEKLMLNHCISDLKRFTDHSVDVTEMVGNRTAVDFIFNELTSKNLLGIFTYEQFEQVDEIHKQAKEMEKERMIEFAWECQEMFKHEIKEHFEEKFNDGGNK